MATSFLSLVSRSSIAAAVSSHLLRAPAASTHQTQFSSTYVKIKNNRRAPKKKKGILVSDGQTVQRGRTLCKQLQLRYYPGENVLLGDRCTLTSIVDGTVIITRETLTPYPDSPIYPGVLKGDFIERVFLHVIPHPQHNKFKLVSFV